MTRRDHRFLDEEKNPSFSSTLLDEIYRSIDDGDRKGSGMKFYTESKKQSRWETEEHLSKLNLSRVSKASDVVGSQARQRVLQTERKIRQGHVDVHDQDALFFSSTSSSSDSSSGLLSSSSPDTESMFAGRSRGSCFAPSRPKPVRTTVPERSEKKHHEERQIASHDDGLIKSKSRALKIYNNLKKLKQPNSPGGKLTSFLNSLFTTGNNNTKKTTKPCFEEANAVRKTESTCSSASSFARSCLSKTSPSTRERFRNNGAKTVRFYPVSVIVDEDSRPCGHKCLYEGDEASLMAVSLPTAWKIATKKKAEEVKEKKNRGIEDAARDFLKEYHHIQKKSGLILKDFPVYEDEDEDDAASCSSSDLFELDHLHEELPVYETTHVGTNRAIANRFIV